MRVNVISKFANAVNSLVEKISKLLLSLIQSAVGFSKIPWSRVAGDSKRRVTATDPGKKILQQLCPVAY